MPYQSLISTILNKERKIEMLVWGHEMLLRFILGYFRHFNLSICSFFATISHISSVAVKHSQRKICIIWYMFFIFLHVCHWYSRWKICFDRLLKLNNMSFLCPCCLDLHWMEICKHRDVRNRLWSENGELGVFILPVLKYRYGNVHNCVNELFWLFTEFLGRFYVLLPDWRHKYLSDDKTIDLARSCLYIRAYMQG